MFKMESPIVESDSFICVHCGTAVQQLFKKYNPSVLKLIHCNNCNKVADGYIEYDTIAIIIDIILFKREAYRHILYNTEFKYHWKLASFLLLVKTYVEWMSTEPSSNIGNMALEHSFYVSFLITLLGLTLFGGIILGCLALHKQITGSKAVNLKIIWKSLVLSNFGQLLMLPCLIWYEVGVPKQVHFWFVIIYCLLSQIQALSVVYKLSRWIFSVILTGANLTQIVITAFLMNKNYEVPRLFKKYTN